MPDDCGGVDGEVPSKACLRVVFEYAGSEHLKETKKGEGSD